MNLLYLRYAVEVAACGSINKAAERLFMDQPNLSRCIKELEASLGVSIFTRSTRGMKPTAEGIEFLTYADSILKQVAKVENLFRNNDSEKKKFSISVPCADYISEAFASFSDSVCRDSGLEFYYKETDFIQTITDILESDYHLGIIHYDESYDKYYKEYLESKGLTYEFLNESRYVLLMNRHSPLASLPEIHYPDLCNFLQVSSKEP